MVSGLYGACASIARADEVVVCGTHRQEKYRVGYVLEVTWYKTYTQLFLERPSTSGELEGLNLGFAI